MFGDILDYVAGALDKPGRAVRGVLGGRPEEAFAALPFSDSLGLSDEKNAVSGANLARDWFGTDPEHWTGQAAGFGLDVALDPTNLFGLGVAGKAARGASLAAKGVEEGVTAAKAANAARDALLAKGAMPAEVAAQTVARDAAGNPLRQYHGTRSAFDEIDLSKAGVNDGTTLGPGYYTTPQPELANAYAGITHGNYDYLAGEAEHALKGFGTPDALGKHLDDVYGRISELDQARAELVPQMYRLESVPGKEAEYQAVQRQVLDNTTQAHELRKQASKLHEGWTAVNHIKMMADKPANVRTHFLDIRNPLDLRGTEFGEDNLHPLLAELQKRMKGGELTRADQFKEALQAHGYDSVIAPHHAPEGLQQTQYVVFDPKQVYKPWVAPPGVPVPPGYSGPSPLRAAASPLGATAAVDATSQQAPTRRFTPTTESFLMDLVGGR